MNRIQFLFLSFLFSISTNVTASPMARIVRVVDWRTVVVECDGRQTAVTLANVEVSPLRQQQAAGYLGTFVGSWVLVENGNVYRSPDALLVNHEMRNRFSPTPDELEHHVMTYLGSSPPATKQAPDKRVPTLPRVEPEAARKRTPPAVVRVPRRLRQP